MFSYIQWSMLNILFTYSKVNIKISNSGEQGMYKYIMVSVEYTWVNSLLWKWTEIIMSFLRLNSNTAFHFFKFFNYYYYFLLYNIVLDLPYINMHLPQVYMCSQSWPPLPPPSPCYPSGSSQCTSPKLPVSCIEPGLAIFFLYDIVHLLMPFSQIITPPPSHTESKRLFYTSVSLLLSRIQGCHYYLSKFHIYALVYCIGVFLSGLLHSV